MKTKSLAIVNLLALLVHILFAYLSQAGKLSRLDVGEVSGKYDTVFAPAGLTFSIWGVIYTSLLVFCSYHLIKSYTSDNSDQANIDTGTIGWLFVINNLAAATWLAVWVNEGIASSLLLIIIQLLTLVFISIKAHIANPERSLQTKLFTHFPLSIYFAWICIATIANASAALVSVNWNGFGVSAEYWTIIMIGAATLISIFIIVVRRNSFFGLVILWALYGIILKRQQVDAIQYSVIITAAWAAMIIIVVALLIRLFRKNNQLSLSKS